MIVYHHLGLGDHIVCNGLVRYLAETISITLLCKEKNRKNIEFMYRDIDNISIYPIEDDTEANIVCNNNCLRLGFAVGGQYYPDKTWDETFYLNANIPFEYSWNKFYYTRDIHMEEITFMELINNKPYIFIHNIDSYNIDRINWNIIPNNIQHVISDKNIPFFNYGKIIENADEIHCIDSSFKHLIDRIPTNGRLFYHRNTHRKPFDIYHSKKEWTII